MFNNSKFNFNNNYFLLLINVCYIIKTESQLLYLSYLKLTTLLSTNRSFYPISAL